MKLLKLLLIILIFVSFQVSAQVGIGTTNPDANSMLDIQSTDKGILIPRVADHSSISPGSGSDYGLLVYDTSTKSFWFWDGSNWVEIWSSSSNKAWVISGNSGTTAGTNFIGTTDNQDVILSRNSSEEIRILSNQVSINDATPYAADRFTVVGDTDEYAINGYASGTGTGVYGVGDTGIFGNGNIGVYGYTNGATNFASYFHNNDTSGTALFAESNGVTGSFLTAGSAVAGTGSGTGIFGYATDTDGTGILGVGNNNSSITTIIGGSGGAFNGTKYGVVAFVSAADNNATAVYGSYTGSTNTDATGVLGYSMPATYYGYGVKGFGGWVGVYGYTDNDGLYGVYANGDMGASGTKSFAIDNPLDPENTILKHFSIESNEVLNIYRGNVTLNQQGESVVRMPNYFKAVNKNYSYQLTAIGAPATGIYIKKEIGNGYTFVIAGGNPGQKISWVVYAERNDPYLQQYPEKRNVIVEKKFKGKYLMPELYGQPKEKGVDYDISKQKNTITTKRKKVDERLKNKYKKDSKLKKQH